eukprot:gene1058-25753_t
MPPRLIRAAVARRFLLCLCVWVGTAGTSVTAWRKEWVGWAARPAAEGALVERDCEESETSSSGSEPPEYREEGEEGSAGAAD